MIISFHSLEDRIVKDALREGAKQGHYELLTKKPVTADGRRDRSQSAVAQREVAGSGKSLSSAAVSAAVVSATKSFRDGIASHTRAKTNLYTSLDAVPERMRPK